jgi:hydrogenase nickel incorporation protein HypA/HybF
MHELQVTESILRIVLKHARKHNVQRILVVHLSIGELSDLEEIWIQRYFDYVSNGTIAERARVDIEKTPVRMECSECDEIFTVAIRKEKNIRCPSCGGTTISLISGDEYHVKNIEVE